MEYDFETLKNRFDALPTDVQDAIVSETVADDIDWIGSKHGLDDTRLDVLSKQAGLVMFGFIRLSEFPQKLADNLSIPLEKGVEIASEIDSTIFTPIKNSLREIGNKHGQGVGGIEIIDEPKIDPLKSSTATTLAKAEKATPLTNHLPSNHEPIHYLPEHAPEHELSVRDNLLKKIENPPKAVSSLDEKLSKIAKLAERKGPQLANVPSYDSQSNKKDPYREPF